MRIFRQFVLATTLVLAAAVGAAHADSIVVEWDANPQAENVLGYIVYVGTASGAYTSSYDVGSQTSFVFTGAVPGQEYFFAVAAYNAQGTGPYSDEQSRYSNAPPTLTQPPNAVSAVGEAASLQLTGSDIYDDVLTFDAAGLPPGLAVDPDTGVISGAATALGSYAVTATASDGVFLASKTFTWVVDSAPPVVAIAAPTSEAAFTTPSSAVALSGTAADDLGLASVTWVNARGGSGTATGTAAWSIASVGLSPGANAITVTAVDIAGRTATAVITVTYAEIVPPTIAIGSPTTAPTHAADQATLFVAGTANDNIAVTAVTWATDRGSSGTASHFTNGFGTSWSIVSLPLQPGTNVLTVTASDAQGNTASDVLSIFMNRAPVPVNPGGQAVYQGVAVSMPLTATDADANPLAWSATGLPPGLALGESTGVIAGIPTTIGSYPVTVTVSDGYVAAQVSFAIGVASPLPPAASPASPIGSTGSTTPAFTWAAVSNAGYYLLSVDDAASGVIERWYTPAQAGCAGAGPCSVVLPQPLVPGLVRWKVLTWNSYGYGPWSSLVNALIEVADPDAPVAALLGPAGPIGTRTPSYTWQPVANAVWYELAVTDAQGTARDYWYRPAEACSTPTCAAAPNVLLAIGPAQWRLRVWRAGGAGPWSAWTAFETADSAPGKATLIDPNAPIGTQTPAFTWNAVLGTSYYLIRISERDGAIHERWYRPVDAACQAGTGTCWVDPNIVLKAGLSTWQVLTWNGSGYGPWSDPKKFTVEIADPAAGVPAPVTPIGTVAVPNPTFSWTAVSGAIAYRLAVSNNAGPALQWWYAPAALGCAAGGPCSVTPQTGLVNGTAEWQVQAWTVNGYGEWTAPVGLVVSIAAPAAPAAVSPAGSTGATPAFTWTASAAATLYYVRVTDSQGLRVDKWVTPNAVGCGLGTGTCTLSGAATLAPGAGSWRVLAWNPSGYSPWSATVAFTVP